MTDLLGVLWEFIARPEYLAGVLTGITVAFIGVMLTPLRAILYERARRWEESRHRAHEARKRDRRAKRSARRQERASRKETKRLAKERLGARFRFRATRDDVGQVGEVIELREKGQVLVEWTSGADRVPTDRDYDRPILMDWRQLTKSPQEQRHWTARQLLDSYDDSDGWVQHERLDPVRRGLVGLWRRRRSDRQEPRR